MLQTTGHHAELLTFLTLQELRGIAAKFPGLGGTETFLDRFWVSNCL